MKNQARAHTASGRRVDLSRIEMGRKREQDKTSFRTETDSFLSDAATGT